MDIPSPQTGIIQELLVNQGDKVSEDILIARMSIETKNIPTLELI
jgi:pyruvate/2-oxoglutarate dehydrogenase complex dihydrolipoamide acyltransferase (E2) component